VPPPPRCVRLTYASDFHLDIVPARKDPTRGETAIEVPDRKLKCWVPNNPLAYQAWFERRCVSLAILEKAEPQPVPALVRSERKPPLKRVVQLVKRHRDVVFAGCPDAPSSILLTTMAATLYQGESKVVPALVQILARMENAVRSAWPRRIFVPNPTNTAEDLCAKFSDDEYVHFVQWILDFSEHLRKLVDVRGLDKVASILKSLFGEKVTTEVVRLHMRKLEEARKARQLRYGSAGA
jgi:hypothetical protein